MGGIHILLATDCIVLVVINIVIVVHYSAIISAFCTISLHPIVTMALTHYSWAVTLCTGLNYCNNVIITILLLLQVAPGRPKGAL